MRNERELARLLAQEWGIEPNDDALDAIEATFVFAWRRFGLALDDTRNSLAEWVGQFWR